MGWHRRTSYALFALVAALAVTVARADAPADVVLDVPYRSQLDGTVWASSNCGPTAIGMVLEAYGDDVSTKTLRDRANQLLGIANPDTGTRIQDLARVVAERGLSTFGPYDGRSFRRWSLDDVRREVRAGRPVIPEVYYPLLPNHRQNPVDTDHYVVVVGLSGDDFIFNDPADRYEPGYHVRMTAEDFARAWGASRFPFAAFSVGPGASGRSLLTPTPTATPAEPLATPATGAPELRAVALASRGASAEAIELDVEAIPAAEATASPELSPAPVLASDAAPTLEATRVPKATPTPNLAPADTRPTATATPEPGGLGWLARATGALGKLLGW